MAEPHHPVDASSVSSEALYRIPARQLSVDHIVSIQNFPATIDSFIAFATLFGEPLPYYSGAGEGVHPEHAAVHRVRYERGAANRGELHAVDGPLPVHSAQSLRTPRPAFFAMLMIDPGWIDGKLGTNGESLFVQWSAAFRDLAVRNETSWRTLLESLFSPVVFPGGALHQIAYDLCDAKDDFDLGVRLKYGLREFWKSTKSNVKPDIVKALNELLVSAESGSALIEVQLAASEFVILDNNRWAHGRRSVQGLREMPLRDASNPRELWSVTLR